MIKLSLENICPICETIIAAKSFTYGTIKYFGDRIMIKEKYSIARIFRSIY